MSLDRILTSPLEFISRLKIKDKKGKYKIFGNLITQEQIEIIEALTGAEHDRIAIVKARQLGITTACRAAMFWETYTSNKALSTALCSNKLNSAVELLKIDKRFYNCLPRPLQREMTARQDRMVFPTTDSQVLAVSAQGDAHNRGYTFSSAHASEFAFYDHPEEFLSSLIASTNDGKIVLESTANHYGDALHNIIQQNHYDNRWKVLFLPWTAFPQYKKKLPKGGIEWDKVELELMELHNLTPEQMYWRRRKIGEIKDERLFRREYPLTIEEAYCLAEDNYFTEEHFEGLQIIDLEPNKTIQILAEHDPADAYVVGVDLAAGVGGDWSVAVILSRLACAPVAFLASNQMSIHDFTVATANLAKRYKATICYEDNYGGGQFKEILNNIGWRHYRAFTTTKKSKLMLYDCLRTHLEEGMIAWLDKPTYTELRSLVKDKNGLAPSHPEGSHDDRAMALAIGIYHLKDIPVPKSKFDRWIAKSKKSQGRSLQSRHPLKSTRNRRI